MPENTSIRDGEVDVPAPELDYKADLRIDDQALDREWMHQPMLYMKWAEKLAQLQHREQRLKDGLGTLRAQIDAEFRNMAKTAGEKVTEAVVASAIDQNPAYIQALENYGGACYDTAVVKAAVTAMDHRKKALENLVQLYISGYFSAPRDRTHRAEDYMEDRARDQVRKHLGRGRENIKNGAKE